MTQNIYDNEAFFQAYGQMPRSVDGLAGAPEWPNLRAMLPQIAGSRVLDLGCGYGWFCRWARENGAAQVLGVDMSERMLARARSATNDPAILYTRGNLECYDPPATGFDLIYSSLALHYIADLGRLLASVHRALVPGGALVFSVEHPILLGPTDPGWNVDSSGRKTWRLDSYLDEGVRSVDWLVKGVIKHHRTIATYLNMLLAAGFTLTHVEEWGPTTEQIAANPDWADQRQRPPFLLVSARRLP